MNWLDGVIIVFLLVSGVLGLLRGFIKSVIPFFGFVLGLFLAFRLAGPFGRALAFLPQPTAAFWVAFAIILVAVIIIAAVVAGLLAKLVAAAMLGWVDRVAGAVWGVALGAIVGAAVLTLWVRFLGEPAVVAQSPIASFMIDKFPIVVSWLPGEFGARGFFY